MLKYLYELGILSCKALNACIVKCIGDFMEGFRYGRALGEDYFKHTKKNDVRTVLNFKGTHTVSPSAYVKPGVKLYMPGCSTSPTYDEMADYYVRYYEKFHRDAEREWSTDKIMTWEDYKIAARKEGWSFMMSSVLTNPDGTRIFM